MLMMVYFFNITFHLWISSIEVKPRTDLVIVDHHASSESLINTATDYIRGLALMNAIHHLVSNGSLWQFGSQQLSHALALSFQRSATTNRIKENKWKLVRRHAPQKLGFWFVAMRLENQLPVLEKAFFFYFLTLCLSASTFCHSTAGKTTSHVVVLFHQRSCR